MKKYNLILVLMVLFLFGCGKYEEGPNLSLRTKKSRLTGEWTVTATYINGTLYTSNTTTESIYEFNKDDSFLYSEKSLIDGQIIYTNRGHWEFLNKKEILRLNYYPPLSTSATQVVKIEDLEILKLTIDRLNVLYTDSSGDKIRVEFIKFG